jgi:iron(III) transport system permease protein
VTGKGDAGLPIALPRRTSWAIHATAVPWAVLTLIIYAMILVGGFVEVWGLKNDFTLRHYIDAFSVTTGPDGLIWSGAAWNSFGTTLTIAAISAPLTAVVGLLTAWLLVRQRFAGKRAFEFGTMLSFAIPGTVIGVSYILAFNVPPLELTGTGVILVISFVFRNMPVGVRAGIASMSQLDKSLDEASLTLGASTFTTVRRVVLPLLRPAIVAALAFSFVRAMTAISAVIFLVSAEYDMATSYIIGRVENGDYGLAIAYSSVLIVVMVIAIALMQLAVGERRLGHRRERGAVGPAVTAGAPA